MGPPYTIHFHNKSLLYMHFYNHPHNHNLHRSYMFRGFTFTPTRQMKATSKLFCVVDFVPFGSI